MTDLRYINNDEFFRLTRNQDKITFLLQYAILAPSTHNTQPWLFKISANYVDIFYDPSKKTPYSDKNDKWLHITMGCCLENLVVAAKYFNSYESYKLILKRNHIARVFFKFDKHNKVDKTLQTLINSILTRQNKRAIFTDKAIENDKVKQLQKLKSLNDSINIHFISDRNKIEEVTSLTAQALKKSSLNYNFRKEFSSWVHNNFSHKKEGMLGYSFNLPLLPSIIFPYLLKYVNMGKITAKVATKNMHSAKQICVITAKKDNPFTWVESGRVIERSLLELESLGLSSTINIALIEVDKLYLQLQKIINTKEVPQFLFAIGYMNKKLQYTPRIDINKKIIV